MKKFKILKKILSYYTREDKYPPTITYKRLSFKEIYLAWKIAEKEIANGDSPQQLGLYVHIPFCPRKCHFCYCNSVAQTNQKVITTYLNAISKELKTYGPIFKKVRFNSLYFGGGTPSYLSIKQIDYLFKLIKKHYRLTKNAQIQFDASPCTLNPEKIKLLKSHGVNRITLGVQSFDPIVLKKNNRIDMSKHISSAISEIKKAGIEEINIDLIAGLDGQTGKIFFRDVDLATKLQPSMIHLYVLTPTSTTPFSKSTISGKKRSIIRTWMNLGKERLESEGFYKIKNDGLGIRESARNVQETDRARFNSNVLGVGTGAQSHIFSHYSYINEPNYNKYILAINNDEPRYFGSKMDTNKEARWFILHNIKDEINFDLFKKLFKKDINKTFKEELDSLKQNGFIKFTKSGIYKNIEDDETLLDETRKKFYEKEVIDEIMKKVKKSD